MSEAQRPNVPVSKEVFIACKIVPIFISVFFTLFKAPWFGSFLLAGACTGLEIFLCKDYFAPRLVGLRWYFERVDGSLLPRLVFFARPLPYVAAPVDVNLFWSAMIGAEVLWTIITFLTVVFCDSRWIFMMVLFTSINFGSLIAFERCRDTSREQADNVARSLLLDTNISFQKAEEEEEKHETQEELPQNQEEEEIV